MENENTVGPQTNSEELLQRIAELRREIEQEITEIRTMLEHAAAARSAEHAAEEDNKEAAPDHRTIRSSVAAGAVLFVLAVSGWAGYPWLRNRAAALAQVPALQDSLITLNQRMKSAEEKLGDWNGMQDSLRDRMSRLEKASGSSQRAAPARAAGMPCVAAAPVVPGGGPRATSASAVATSPGTDPGVSAN